MLMSLQLERHRGGRELAEVLGKEKLETRWKTSFGHNLIWRRSSIFLMKTCEELRYYSLKQGTKLFRYIWAWFLPL